MLGLNRDPRCGILTIEVYGMREARFSNEGSTRSLPFTDRSRSKFSEERAIFVQLIYSPELLNIIDSLLETWPGVSRQFYSEYRWPCKLAFTIVICTVHRIIPKA